MNDYPCIALQACRRQVRGCIAEPAFGYILETFQFGWRQFPQHLTRFLTEWNPYNDNRTIPIAVCPDDPWPTGVLDGLRKNHMVTALDIRHVRYILLRAQDILETSLSYARPHLMAFLANHDDLQDAAANGEVATAWALQFARDQLLKAELSRQHLRTGEPDPWDEFVFPTGTRIRMIP
jgi:hypothetical protein